jgi:hypothetical protein
MGRQERARLERDLPQLQDLTVDGRGNTRAHQLDGDRFWLLVGFLVTLGQGSDAAATEQRQDQDERPKQGQQRRGESLPTAGRRHRSPPRG